MKTLCFGIFLVALSALSLAQETTPGTSPVPQAQNSQAQPAPSTSATGKNTKIAPGSVIPVQLTKGIDAKKAKTGDEIQAQVTQDLKAGNGDVIVPKNTKIIGRVTESQQRNKEQKESQVGISFDRAVLKEGDVTLPMSIQAVIAQSYLSAGNNANNSAGAETSGQTASAPAGGMSPGGRGAVQGTQSSPNPNAAGASEESAKSSAGPPQPINGKTQGILGIPDMKLSTAEASQGSVLSSDKNNVKLEGGTLLLLRVNQ